MTEFVTTVVADGVATLLLSRPPTNALTRQVCREITEAAASLGERDDVCALIVFGGHEIFSVGQDLSERKTLSTTEAGQAGRLLEQAVHALAAVPRPTVAAITGYALGAGQTLALAADWRVSGDNVKFGATEILAGLAPAAGGAVRLAGAVGGSKAKDMVFSGRFVNAREALDLGLIDEMVAPDAVYDTAVAWASRFLDYSPVALAAAKTAFGPDGALGRRADVDKR
ncbi:MAG: enoyl-CoA hydratase [Actinomycetia bacterium]|nr:enoyl-CoA hydratase [Actinomycetes bacterium]MCH9701064.1 enoyl-CoA hydratase [Actinomycetes bacterium]MCH9761375.1 enoyl-CoA hydratase [Actinomycetes bacterium]